jgi:hypothetical protein
MYTSILLVALSGVAPSADTKAPSWSLDYGAATKLAAQSKKPMAIFLAPGKGSYEKIGRDGGLGADAQQILSEKYICVHINTSTSAGKELAQSFRMPEGLGIVISDSKAENQAFRHEGDLARADLVRYLKRYGDPSYVVVQTESNPGPATSTAPVFYSGGFCPTCSGSGCPGGNCSSAHRGRR